MCRKSVNLVTVIWWVSGEPLRVWQLCHLWNLTVKILVALTLCDPMDYSPPGCLVHGILQSGTLEWVAIPFSRGSSWPRGWTWVSCITGRLFTIWATYSSNEIFSRIVEIQNVGKVVSTLLSPYNNLRMWFLSKSFFHETNGILQSYMLLFCRKSPIKWLT